MVVVEVVIVVVVVVVVIVVVVIVVVVFQKQKKNGNGANPCLSQSLTLPVTFGLFIICLQRPKHPSFSE